MLDRNTLNEMFISIRKDMFDLINMIEIKIDVGYILEEIEELSYEVKKIKGKGEGLSQEMKEIYTRLYKRYKNKLAAFLSPRESNQLIDKIKSWIHLLPTLI